MEYDRPSEFVMDDEPTLGPGVKMAMARYKQKDRNMEEITGIAVCDGTTKNSKIVRFMYTMRSPWMETLFKWVAIPYERR